MSGKHWYERMWPLDNLFFFSVSSQHFMIPPHRQYVVFIMYVLLVTLSGMRVT